MTWQFLIASHIAFSTVFALALRKIAQSFPDIPRLSVALMYLLVISPAGIIYALIEGNISFNFTPATFLFLVVAGFLFAGFNIFSYIANTHVDAAQFTVIQNTQAVFTIAASGILLGEVLNTTQIAGAGIMILAAVIISIKTFTKGIFVFSKWSWVALLSAIFLGVALTNEKYLIGQMTLSTYYIVGWGLQTIAMTLLAWKEWPKVKKLKAEALFGILKLGILRTLAGFAIVTALSLADSGLLASLRSYKAVLVFVGALIFLGEKKNIWRKLIGAVLATIGLLLLVNG